MVYRGIRIMSEIVSSIEERGLGLGLYEILLTRDNHPGAYH